MTQSNQDAEKLFNHGYALMQSGRLDEAINAYQRAVALRPGYWQAWNNLANAFMLKGELPRAIQCFHRADELQPNHPPTQYGRAHALRLSGRRREAIAVLTQCLNSNPDLPPILDELAVALDEEGRKDEAITVLRRLCKVQPDLPEAHNRLGALLAESDVEAAIAEFKRAIALRPNFAEAQSNLGLALAQAGQLDEAEAAHRGAIESDPNYAQGQSNLGRVLWQAGRLDEAEAAHRRAIEIDPQYAEARWNLSSLQLQRGDYESGWKNYEARHELKKSIIHRSFSQPMWDGSDLKGRPILLHSEQGFGDTIQFVRYAPLVADRGGKVLLSCQPGLQRLLATVAGVEQVIGSGDPPPPFDVHCPLGSLPFLFGTTLATVPARVPYVSAEAANIEMWRDRLSREQGKLKVGVAWAGNPAHGHDRRRSIDPGILKALGQIPSVTLVSLQKGSTRPASDLLPGLIDWTHELKDFADTAALIGALDLVISVDTAVVHLSGALGMPTWVMLSTAVEWRYLLGRDDSPWYPTLRIFRQTQAGDWAPVVSVIALELQKYRERE